MNDSIAAVVWLTANLLLLSTAWQWSRRLFPEDELRQTAIHVLALSWGCVVANTLLLGALGILAPALLLASVCTSCLAALVVLLAVAAVELATACGLSRPLCHLTGMAIVTTRPMLRQLVSAENDVAVAALSRRNLAETVPDFRGLRKVDCLTRPGSSLKVWGFGRSPRWDVTA